jgi:small multidrug resistance pump
MKGFLLLGAAILLELFSTSIGGMAASFYLMSFALTTIPLGIAYAIWSGVGTVFTALIGILVWKEHLSVFSGAGIVLIAVGVVLLNLKGAGH